MRLFDPTFDVDFFFQEKNYGVSGTISIEIEERRDVDLEKKSAMSTSVARLLHTIDIVILDTFPGLWKGSRLFTLIFTTHLALLPKAVLLRDSECSFARGLSRRLALTRAALITTSRRSLARAALLKLPVITGRRL